MHSWADGWPHWEELYKAEKYFCDLYERCTYLKPITKEKWGTIRYEHTFGWIIDNEHARIFRESVMRTIKKYPNVAAEIAYDAGFVLNDVYFKGWCNGIVFIKEVYNVF